MSPFPKQTASISSQLDDWPIIVVLELPAAKAPKLSGHLSPIVTWRPSNEFRDECLYPVPVVSKYDEVMPSNDHSITLVMLNQASWGTNLNLERVLSFTAGRANHDLKQEAEAIWITRHPLLEIIDVRGVKPSDLADHRESVVSHSLESTFTKQVAIEIRPSPLPLQIDYSPMTGSQAFERARTQD